MNILRPQFTSQHLPADTVLFEQGSPAEFLYIVVEGEVLVSFKPDDAPRMDVGRIQPGGIVGWSAAIGSRLYTSAAITTQPGILLRVRGSDLRHIFRSRLVGRIFKERMASIIVERAHGTRAQIIAMFESGLQKHEPAKEIKS